MLSAQGQVPVTSEQGAMVAREIGAKYIECSAKTGDNVKEVFNLALRESMLPEKDADEEGESWEKERSLARGARCCAGSLARMASAKAFDA